MNVAMDVNMMERILGTYCSPAYGVQLTVWADEGLVCWPCDHTLTLHDVERGLSTALRRDMARFMQQHQGLMQVEVRQL